MQPRPAPVAVRGAGHVRHARGAPAMREPRTAAMALTQQGLCHRMKSLQQRHHWPAGRSAPARVGTSRDHQHEPFALFQCAGRIHPAATHRGRCRSTGSSPGRPRHGSMTHTPATARREVPAPGRTDKPRTQRGLHRYSSAILSTSSGEIWRSSISCVVRLRHESTATQWGSVAPNRPASMRTAPLTPCERGSTMCTPETIGLLEPGRRTTGTRCCAARRPASKRLPPAT